MTRKPTTRSHGEGSIYRSDFKLRRGSCPHRTVSLELVQLGPATFHRLRNLERTPGQRDPWVAEVEDFILGPEPRSAI